VVAVSLDALAASSPRFLAAGIVVVPVFDLFCLTRAR